MHVVATAGHVDHGKSALVRALTGSEPDRWEQERRRGMTIDLGYAWMTLDSGEQLAFVDVPGHQHFIGNMLAGIGPAPAVVFVVAADEGWRQQSEEHLAAIDALGLEHGLLVITRSDLADPAATMADATARLRASSLGTCEALAVSARTGLGMTHLRHALDRLVARLPTPVTDGRVRLWIDRSFTIRGSGTVVTGTLGEGTVAVGDKLLVGDRAVTVRGLQSLEQSHQSVSAVARVALNLRGIAADDVGRGDALLTPDAFTPTSTVDARLTTAPPTSDRLGHPASDLPGDLSGDLFRDLPTRAMLHVGTAAVEVHVRPLSAGAVRLTLPRPLPLRVGDRAILRDPGQRHTLGGVVVADVDPPPLRRRGAAARRGEELAAGTGTADLVMEVGRRGAMRIEQAIRLGLDVADVPSPTTTPTSRDTSPVVPVASPVTPNPGQLMPVTSPAMPVTRHGDWLVGAETWATWHVSLSAALRRRAAEEPLEPTLTLESARALTGIPDRALLLEVANEASLQVEGGRIGLPGAKPSLGATAEAGLAAIEAKLAADPFAAPEARALDAAGLGPREIAAAARLGRVLRLPEDVLLLPSAPARAMRILAALPQPFTTSDARQALGSTRRVVIPLLEHLDARGWTRRLDGAHREVKR